MDNKDFEILDFNGQEYSGNTKVSGHKGARVDEKNISFLRKLGQMIKNGFKRKPERFVEDAEKALAKNKSFDYINAAYLDALDALDEDNTLENQDKDRLYMRLSAVAAQNELNHFIEKVKENVYTLSKNDIIEFEKCVRALKTLPDMEVEKFRKKISSVHDLLTSKIQHITDEEDLKLFIDLFNNSINFCSPLWYKQLYGEDWDKIVDLEQKIEKKKLNNETYFEEAKELLEKYDKHNLFLNRKIELASYIDEQNKMINNPNEEKNQDGKIEKQEIDNDSNKKEETQLEPVTISDESREMESTVSELNKMMSDFNAILGQDKIFGSEGELQKKGNAILTKMQKFETLLHEKEEKNKEKVLKDLDNSIEELITKASDGVSVEDEKQALLNEIKSLINQGIISEDVLEKYKDRISGIQTKETFDADELITRLNVLSAKKIEDPVEYSKECDALLSYVENLTPSAAVHVNVCNHVKRKVVELKNKALEMQVNENPKEDDSLVQSQEKQADIFTTDVPAQLVDNQVNSEEKMTVDALIDSSEIKISQLMDKKTKIEDQLDELRWAGEDNLVAQQLKNQIKALNEEIEIYQNKIRIRKEQLHKKSEKKYEETFNGTTNKTIAQFNSNEKKAQEYAEAYEGEKKYLEELIERMIHGEDIESEYEETKSLLEQVKNSLSEEQYDSLDAYVKLIGDSKKRFSDFRANQKASEVRQDAFNQEMQKWNTLLGRLNSGEDVHNEESDFLPEYGKACTIFENNKQHYTKEQLTILEKLKNQVQDLVWKPKEESKSR